MSGINKQLLGLKPVVVAAAATDFFLTAPASSGTEVDLTGIPAGMNFIDVMPSLVGDNTGGAVIGLQLGTAAGFEVSGYVGTASRNGSILTAWGASAIFVGASEGALFNSGIIRLSRGIGNTWSITSLISNAAIANYYTSAGEKALAGELTQLRMTAGGTIAFDGGNLSARGHA